MPNRRDRPARTNQSEPRLRAAADALEHNGARLSETGGELRAREGELVRTSELTREVAERAESLHAETVETVKRARGINGEEPSPIANSQ